MEKWLVTGATGLLGANAGAYLSPRREAVGLVRPHATVPRTYARTVQGRLEDARSLSDTIMEFSPDVILHAAALSGHELCEREPEAAWRINVDGSRTIARIARNVGARLIYISTDAVFDGSVGVYSEDFDPNPFSVYGRTKLEGERAILEEVEALIVRTNFFGWSPLGSASILEFFFNALTSGKQVKGFTDFHVTTLYVNHLLDAVLRLVACQAVGIIHVASRDSLSKYEFAVELADVFQLDKRLLEASSEEIEPRVWARSRDISLDISKYEGITGHVLPTQSEGLKAARADMMSLRHLVRVKPPELRLPTDHSQPGPFLGRR